MSYFKYACLVPRCRSFQRRASGRDDVERGVLHLHRESHQAGRDAAGAGADGAEKPRVAARAVAAVVSEREATARGGGGDARAGC